MTIARWVAVCTALSVAPAATSGQGLARVRGEVVYADGRTPAPAVLIEVNDRSGDLVARAVTDETGRFVATVGKEGAYQVRALRVGYRPTVVETVASSGSSPTVRIVLGEQVIRIAAARVTTDDVCGIRSDSGKLVATAWEEVRKAIASASVSGSGMRLASRVLNWRSTREPDGSGPVWNDYTFDVLDNPRPFAAAAAESLTARGYSRSAPGGAVDYFGPDAETLVSDGFAASNCFRLVGPHPQRAAWIGIGFRPARQTGSVVAISGTFWIDTATAALRLLEYRYTNVPLTLARLGAGGRIAFDRLQTGEWLVRSWAIRLGATLAGVPEGMSLRRAGARSAPELVPDSRVFAQTSGGEVLSVSGAEGAVLGEDPVSFRARFVAAGPSAKLEGATIELLESSQFAVADSGGAVAMSVGPGRFTMLASTRLMRLLSLPALRRTVSIPAADSLPLVISVPDDRALLRDRCGTDAEARGRAVIFGRETPRVRAEDPEIVLSVEWLADADRGGNAGRRWVDDSLALAVGRAPRELGQPFTPDGLGRWFVCGVPRRAAVRVAAATAEGRLVAVRHSSIGEFTRVLSLESVASVRP